MDIKPILRLFCMKEGQKIDDATLDAVIEKAKAIVALKSRGTDVSTPAAAKAAAIALVGSGTIASAVYDLRRETNEHGQKIAETKVA